MVLARTGRLAELGAPLEYVAGLLGPRLPFGIAVRDSRSTAAGARAATEDLIGAERVSLVLTLGGTRTLPAVAATCERLGTPCLSSALPWQLYLNGRGGGPFRWTYHAGWGVDDIAAVFADMWDLLDPAGAVGCLWNDGEQGHALREYGFAATATARGRHLVDAPYAEPAADFGAQLATFRDCGVRVVTSAAAAGDLAGFLRQAAATPGQYPRLVTCSRWLTYPFGVRRYGLDRVATVVYWTPAHQYLSSLDGAAPAGLAGRYERDTGRGWAQPLGLSHGLMEVAAHALGTAGDPTDRGAVARALAGTRLATMAGTLDWTAGPAPNVARIPLAGGQWHAGDRPGRPGGPELVVVTNSRAPAVPRGGELAETSRPS